MIWKQNIWKASLWKPNVWGSVVTVFKSIKRIAARMPQRFISNKRF